MTVETLRTAFWAAKEDLKRDEGFRSHIYRCSAQKRTIGFGINLDDGITEEEADMLLEYRMGKHVEELQNALSWVDLLPGAVYRAVLNLHYNLGHHRFMKFKKMLAALNENDFKRAADELLDSKYARQVGKRAERLADLIREGDEE